MAHGVLFCHSVMSCSRQSKVQTDWYVRFFLAAGSSAADRGQAEAKCLRPRPRPKFWLRGHFGLEDLASLPIVNASHAKASGVWRTLNDNAAEAAVVVSVAAQRCWKKDHVKTI